MPLSAPLWSANRRLQSAANNAPPMRQNEPDAEAVKLLQQALKDTGFMLGLAAPTGFFGRQTAAAVRDVEETFNLDPDEGVAGRQVLGVLDLLLRGERPPTGGRSGKTLAEADKPAALLKVDAALGALRSLQRQMEAAGGPVPVKDVTTAALATHFKLLMGDPGTSLTRRTATLEDMRLILRNFNGIRGVLVDSARQFTSGTPTDGIDTPAEAPFGGPITFGPAFADFNNRIGRRIGPNSRVAIIIHESTHVIDNDSGDDLTSHVSEFSFRYESQPADHALHNPSAYAAFAAHIVLRRDPKPRFGLGPGARGL